MATITLDGVTKRYADGALAVKDANLDIADGELVILVGPSGCGKSTTLNMIAGLEDITEGELRIDGTVVNELSPRDRDIAMVFQSYALYPHMTVFDNMAFSLQLAKVDKATIDTKVREAAQTLELTDHLNRKPANLSGGQRQRVAMGRAIVRDPAAFLMDEPLSNLDAKLRVQMRTQVSKIQKRLGTTMVYVTHDQVEAMTLGDRIAIMRQGIILQVGSPAELYTSPTNLFVAGFVGSPAMNFLPGELTGGGSELTVKTPLGDFPLPAELAQRIMQSGGKSGQVVVGIRPEHFEDARMVDAAKRDQGVVVTAPVDIIESLGADVYAYVSVEGMQLDSEELAELRADAGTQDLPGGGSEDIAARLDGASQVKEGDQLDLWLDPAQLYLFDPESGKNLVVAR